jgi:integrase
MGAFHLDCAEWRIPAERMKMREDLIVPLSRQAMAVLEELKPATGRGQYLFPSLQSPGRPMSENTINGALRRLGYVSDEMTGHGFRAWRARCSMKCLSSESNGLSINSRMKSKTPMVAHTIARPSSKDARR